MTKALYLEDSHLKNTTATVVEVIGASVVLDKTVFYPNGGGQPTDTGTLKRISDERTFTVTGVRKDRESGKILHDVAEQGLQTGDDVEARIDWERRYTLMRMHTAAHLLSAVVNQDKGALITGNQLDVDQSRIDFSLEQFDSTIAQSIVAKANELIKKDAHISTETVSREAAEQMPNVARLAKGLPEGIREIRLVKIGDIDVQADGGTHVKQLSEIGKIVMLRTENKGKNNRRMYFNVV